MIREPTSTILDLPVRPEEETAFATTTTPTATRGVALPSGTSPVIDPSLPDASGLVHHPIATVHLSEEPQEQLAQRATLRSWLLTKVL